MRLIDWKTAIDREEEQNNKIRTHIHRKIIELVLLQKKLVIAEQLTATLRRILDEPR